jgi:predicted outer membrane protein
LIRSCLARCALARSDRPSRGARLIRVLRWEWLGVLGATGDGDASATERTLQRGDAGIAKGRTAEGTLVGPRAPKKDDIMLRKSLAAVFMFLFMTGAAFAGPPANEKTAQLSENVSILHATSQWSMSLSEMADKRAKSDLVKNYARAVATANASSDAKLQSIAQKKGFEIVPLNPQTEEGASVLDRMKGETVLLGSLEGDAFDKEYMTLVTNTQQSVLHVLETSKALATDQEVKQFFGDLTTNVQNRLKTAQDILAKIYGDQI